MYSQRTSSTPRESCGAYAPCPQETPFANSRHRQSGAPQPRRFRYHVRPDAIRSSHPDLYANLAFRAPRIITSTTRATAVTHPANRDHEHAMSYARSTRPTATIGNQTTNDAPTPCGKREHDRRKKTLRTSIFDFTTLTLAKYVPIQATFARSNNGRTLRPHSRLTPHRRSQRFMPVRKTTTRKHHGTVPTRDRIPTTSERRHHHHRISLPSSTPDPDASLPSNSEHIRFQIGAEHVPCTGQVAKPPGSSPRSPDARNPISSRSRPPPGFSHRHLNPIITIAQHRLTSAITSPPSVVYRSQRVFQPRYVDAPDFTLVQDTRQHGPISPMLHREHHTLVNLRQHRYTRRLRDCHAPPQRPLTTARDPTVQRALKDAPGLPPIFRD